MRKILTSIIITTLFMITGCYSGMTGKVVDAETGQPIEGAVVLVEWTKTSGLPGLTASRSYKVIELVTDNNGIAEIEGVLSPFVDAPDVAVYKQGYVMWNNHYIFPGKKKRTDFRWEKDYVFKLEKYVPSYSHIDHTSFIRSSIHPAMATEKKQLMEKAYRWEELKSSEEWDKKILREREQRK